MDIRHTLILPAALLAVSAFAADEPAPAAATAAEPPAELDTVEVTPEKRVEMAFRQVQMGLERIRSDKVEDADLIVCKREKPTGSHIPVINCATNRFWQKIRASSLQAGVGSVGGAVAGGGGSARKDDKVFSMSMKDFNDLKKRFGRLPKELRDTL